MTFSSLPLRNATIRMVASVRSVASINRITFPSSSWTTTQGNSQRTLATAAAIITNTTPTALTAKLASSTIHNNKRLFQVGGLALTLAAAQYSLGDATDFFEHRFITNKNSVDMADFYGTEDFMEVFCVFPIIANLMMRGAEFDEQGHIHARGLLGANGLEVSIDFDEERKVSGGNDTTTGDGEEQPETIAWFNKKERFCDVAPSYLGGFTLWKMTQNFGYHRLDNGTCEVYHHGEHFQGLFPIRILFQLHARYVFWATQRYVNSAAFGSENDQDSEVAEEFRQNVPLHVFQDYIVGLTKQVQTTKDKTSATDEKRHNELQVTIHRLNTLSATLKKEEESEHQQQQKQHSKMTFAQTSSPTSATASSVTTTATMIPRIQTLQSKKTKKVSRVRLIVDDPETSDTIRTAMKQIGSAKGHGHEPVARMRELQRHTTLASSSSASHPKQESNRVVKGNTKTYKK